MRHVNMFQGMDADTAPELQKNTTYLDGENFRLTIDESNKSLQVVTGKGPKRVAYSNTHKIVHITKVEEYIVLFLSPITTGDYYFIFRIDVNTLLGITSPEEILPYVSPFIMVLSGKGLNFGDSLSTVVSVENKDTYNVYFVSNTNETPIRRVNIKHNYGDITNISDSVNLFNNQPVYTPVINKVEDGNLKCGLYRYTYQIFDKNGSETAYSAPSLPVLLTSSNFNSSSDSFKGDDSSENSGKGIVINIPKAKDKYARIVQIYFSDNVNLPICTIIYEGKITDDYFLFKDTGNSVLGTTSIEDIALTFANVTSKDIESKNGYMFLANVKEYSFDIDIDTRAYRKNQSGNIVLHEGGAEVYNSPNIPSDPVTYENAYNPYLYFDNPQTDTTRCEFKSGSILGGDGNNIQYEFITKIYKFSDVLPNRTGFEAGNPIFFKLNSVSHLGFDEAQDIGYQRDEIYRFGIVFYDKYGNRTPVKWIDDIRFPSYFSHPLTYRPDSYWYFRVLGIRFIIKNVSALANLGVVAYQIVRAIRTREDSTVYDAGILSTLYQNGTGTLYLGNFPGINRIPTTPIKDVTTPEFTNSILGQPLTMDTNGGSASSVYFDFISPESAYYKEWRDNVTRVDVYPTYRSAKHKLVKNSNPSSEPIWGSAVGCTVMPTTGNIIKQVLYIKDSYFWDYRAASGDNKITIPIDSKYMYNFTKEEKQDYRYRRGIRYSSFVMKPKYYEVGADYRYDTNFWGGTYPEYLAAPGYALRRKVIYPYGGPSKVAKENTKYIPCSKLVFITDPNSNIVDVFNGDTYIGLFNYMLSILHHDTNGKVKQPIAVQALVESRINLWYNNNINVPSLDSGVVELKTEDNTYNFEKDEAEEFSHWALHEEKGIYPVNNDKTVYFTQSEDLYTYNSVYSALDPKVYYYPKSSLQSDEDEFGARILKTPKKLNNALSDSWSRININDYIDLDSAYGEIKKLVQARFGLVGFQSRGITMIPVEERALITDDNQNQLVAGKSGVLDRYEYLSTNYGLVSPTHVLNTGNGIYFVDANEKALCRITDKIEVLNVLGKIQSMTNSDVFDSVGLVYNEDRREVLFVVDNKSYLFLEDLNAFISKLDSTYTMGLNINNISLGITSITGSGGALYILDKGNNRYYKTDYIHGAQVSPSKFKIKFAVTPNNGYLNRIDTVLINAVTNVRAVFDHIYLDNNYQNNDFALDSTNLEKRFRTWRIKFLRDGDNKRFIDYYNTLTFENGDTNDIILKSIYTDYKPIFNR